MELMCVKNITTYRYATACGKVNDYYCVNQATRVFFF